MNSPAARFNTTPFDIEDVFWAPRGEDCTFDTMIEEFSLNGYHRLARDATEEDHDWPAALQMRQQ